MKNTSTANALTPTPFPTGNSIVGPSVLEYAERYQTFLNQTAEAILSLTETVFEASTNLNPDEFIQFKEEVGLNSRATVSKFIAIGKKVSLLRPYTDRLPHAWTTLYRLVQLKQFQFDKVKSSLSTDMTAADIERILGRRSRSSKKVHADIKLYLYKMSSEEKKEFVLDLRVGPKTLRSIT
jgi:hypothetical protein